MSSPWGPKGQPKPPVDIPAHLRHGTSYVHRWYKCRCKRCLAWRRDYDSRRDKALRHGSWQTRRRLQAGGWYVCVDCHGESRGYHLFEGHRCTRCGANKAVEELWESRWRATS